LICRRLRIARPHLPTGDRPDLIQAVAIRLRDFYPRFSNA
jgi:hypothetical protein